MPKSSTQFRRPPFNVQLSGLEHQSIDILQFNLFIVFPFSNQFRIHLLHQAGQATSRVLPKFHAPHSYPIA